MNSRAHHLNVGRVIKETTDAVSLVFDVPDELTGQFVYSPGQFLTLRVPSEQTGSVARCYSLSSSPHGDEQLSVTVKRTAGGYASNWICDNAEAGMRIAVLEPSGAFVPRSLDSDVLLCAAGSGVTPIMSITKSVLRSGAGHVAMLYANRDWDSVIFAREFAELGERYSGRLTVLHWLEADKGLPSADDVVNVVRPYVDRDVFLCGPAGFVAVTQSAMAALQVSPSRIHREEYRSLETNPFEAAVAVAPPVVPVRRDRGAEVEVDLDGETHVLSWPKGKKLLDVLLDAGLDPPYVCRESACGTCVCSVKEGKTRMVMNESLIDEDLDMGLTLACQTLPESERIHIAFDQ